MMSATDTTCRSSSDSLSLLIAAAQVGGRGRGGQRRDCRRANYMKNEETQTNLISLFVRPPSAVTLIALLFFFIPFFFPVCALALSYYHHHYPLYYHHKTILSSQGYNYQGRES
jgi:hypothetical protein